MKIRNVGNDAIVLTGCDGLAGQDINAQPPLVQVLNEDSTSSERRYQLDLEVVEKVVVFAGEARVGLLLDFENDISGLDSWSLVTLATEFNARTTLDTTVDVNVQDLSVDDSLLAVTVLAAIFVLDDLSLSVAVGASRLEPLDHGTHLAHHGLHTLAITAGTALDRALLSTTTLALGADDGALKCQLGDLPAVDVLERDLVGVVDRTGLGWASIAHAAAEHSSEAAAAATAKELGEQVLGSHATTTAASTTLKTSLAHLVVDAALLRILEDFVGVGDLFELVLGLFIAGVLVCAGVSIFRSRVVATPSS